jgi:hypothetical protein
MPPQILNLENIQNIEAIKKLAAHGEKDKSPPKQIHGGGHGHGHGHGGGEGEDGGGSEGSFSSVEDEMR